MPPLPVKLLASICLGLLLSLPLLAQRTIVGRVISRSTGEAIDGTTVLLKGTTRGVLTNADGRFSLPLTPADSLPRLVVFSAIGYISVERQQATRADSVLNVALGVENQEFCTLSISASAQLRLWSGLRYAPVGVQAVVFRRFLPLPATLGYQTNLRRNHQWLAELELPASCRLGNQRLRSSLRHNGIRLGEDAFRFSSYQLRASMHPSLRWLPVVHLGAGYARHRTEGGRHDGLGYELGLSRYFSRLDIQAQASATRWPGYWQWQGSLRHYFGRVQLGLQANSLGRYQELSLSAGLDLY
jgi:CarboxypepD_reg-like domain